MIRIGCTGFNEHVTLLEKQKLSLYDYAKFFPIVELDTSFYFIPKIEHVRKWLGESPENFKFVMKIPAVFTKQRELKEEETFVQLANEMIQSIQPMMEEKRLFCLLAQFPASFECTQLAVNYLEKVKELFNDIPLAIEFRHKSWYDDKWKKEMQKFMEGKNLSLVIVDEPKKLPTTIPFDSYVTHPSFTLLRFHGRNDAGWIHTGKEARAYRTLYDYQRNELQEFQQAIQEISKHTKEVGVIFNNNSGGHAAKNALELKELLSLSYDKLNPKQLSLF